MKGVIKAIMFGFSRLQDSIEDEAFMFLIH